MFNWKMKATNAIYLEDTTGQEGRPFKSRFLQAGLVKYNFGVCLLKKETIDKFVNTFVECPVIIDHKDNITENDVVGTIQKIWFSSDDGWFWCSGIITDDKAIKLIENGYNVSCQYRIIDYADNDEGKLHNANPYDKEILNGVFEHLAIVENPRYEDAFIAVNAYIATNNDFNEDDHPRDDEGKFTDGNGSKTFDDKIKDIKPIQIERTSIPQFESKKELSNWMKDQFQQLGSVKIEDTGIDLKLSGGNANREAIKRRASKDENKAVITKFEEIVSKAIKKDDRKADDRHIKDQEIYYNKFQIDGEDYEVEIFVDKPYGIDKDSHYAGHNASKIKIAPRDTMNAPNGLIHHAKGATYIIPNLEIDFNPNVTINKAVNKFQKVFDYIRNTEGEPMDNETKNIFSQLVDALKTHNEADDEKNKKDEKASNEDVDKRKLIDEVGGILKGKVDEEIWRTIIGKIEKVAYDKSSTGTADNSKAKNEEDDEKDGKNKCRNEDVDKRDLIRQIMAIAGKHEDNEDVRTIAKLAEKLAYDKSETGTADNRAKNEEKLYEELKERVEKEAENKKAKNSMDALKAVFFEGTYKPQKLYMSQKEGVELGKELY